MFQTVDFQQLILFKKKFVALLKNKFEHTSMIIVYIDRSDDNIRDDVESKNLMYNKYEKVLIDFVTDNLSRIRRNQLHARDNHCVDDKDIDDCQKSESFIIQ